jgi:hypothetical protein
MVVFIGWIVAYPFDQIFIPLQPRIRQLAWTACFALSGLVLCWYIGHFTVYYTTQTLHLFGTDDLQLWIQEATFLLSAFVVARVLLRGKL